MEAANNQATTKTKVCKHVPKPSTLRGQTEFTLLAKQIDNSKVSDLARLLRSNTSLTFLGFRGWVEDIGAQAIASSLKHNKTLKTLNFDTTRVGNHGVEALAEAITLKCSLTHLSLQYCPITDKGALFLVHALAIPSCQLQVLRLDFCPDITDATGSLMLKTLIHNRTSKMEIVGLKDTAVSKSIQREIKYLLLPGGRDLEKRISPSCAAAAYFSRNFSVPKSELDTLHGLVKNVGPLSSTTTNTVKVNPPLTPQETIKGVNAYKKYAYTSARSSRPNSSYHHHKKKELLFDEDAEEEKVKQAQEEIDFVHSKYHLRPLLLNTEEKRRQGASTSNIKMLLKFNAKLADKMRASSRF